MGEKPDQIERHIYETRSELGDNFHELQEKVRTAFDWRAQFQQRPWTCLGIAMGGGVVLSALLGGRRGNSRWSPSSESTRDRWRPETTRPEYTGAQRQEKANPIWEDLRGAALAIAGGHLGSIFDQVLPGFRDEFTKRRNARDWPQQRRTTTSRPNGPESRGRIETEYLPQS